MNKKIDLEGFISELNNKVLKGRKERCNDNDDEYDDYDGDDDDDGAYGPYASFDQSASEGTFLEDQLRTTQLIIKKASGKMITRLKKPRDLYALSKQFSAQMTQRWPAEMQIIAKKPHHIYYVPLKPEALYKPAQNVETKSLPRTSHIRGKIVYDNSPDSSIKYFMRSKCSKKSANAKSYYQLKDHNDTTLLFESRFESGNLMKAIKIGEHDYELWLRFDLYTNKHTQWYYFMVQNARPGIYYRFTIMNFIKPDSLYNNGMRPLMYSEVDAENKGIGWMRTGTKIKYYRNDIRFLENGREKFYYSLTWTCVFHNENDTYYFAHCYPYTYSNLQDYLGMLASDPVRCKCFKQRVLCSTLAGNYVYVLTITAPTKRRNQAEMKKAIVITARVHPGETNSSWMMKGFLDFLTSNSQDAKLLRENFVFKVIPMLNPDGVIAGNYRCSLAGRDLNRNYKTVLKESFPPIWHTRAMVKKLQEEREILMFCDLHGHSRKKNIFIYGCENKQEKTKRFWGRVFPAMLAKNSPDKFSLGHCRFKVQKCREGTGRIFMWNFGVPNSFTMEASFCGSSLRHREGFHFNVADYESMAYDFCDTLLDFYDPNQSKFYKVLSEIVGIIKKAIMEKLEISEDDVKPDEVDIEDQLHLLSEIEADSGGSDSSLSDGLPMQLLHATVPELSRQRRLKTKKERNKSILKNLSSKELRNSRQQLQETSQLHLSSAKSDRKRSEELSTTNSAKPHLCYSQRETSAGKNPVPHFVTDRFIEKSKLKKEYLNLLAADFVNNGNDELSDLKEVPHCKFTAGISSHYQGSKSGTTCERCYHSCSEGSDEDAKLSNARRRPVDQYPEFYWQRFGSSEQNANAVLDIAKRITVYNHRVTQSVSLKVAQKAPGNSKPTWQQRDDKQLGELSFGPLNTRCSNGAPGWDTRQRRRSKGLRKFQIRQEPRVFANGPSALQRHSNHFELKRTKSSAHADRLRTAPNDGASIRMASEIANGHTIRRLPQLQRKSEDAASQVDEKPMIHCQADSSRERLQSSSEPRWSNRKIEHTDENSRNSSRSYQSEKAQDEVPSIIDKNEVSILKEKMLQCGASGLVTYVLSAPHSQNSSGSQISPKVSSMSESLLHCTRSLDTLRVGMGKDINSHSKTLESGNSFENNKPLAPFVRGSSSEIDVAVGKTTRKILAGIDRSFESHDEGLRDPEDNRQRFGESRADDILREGLVTLNVNLNNLPVVNSTFLEENSSSIEENLDAASSKDSNASQCSVDESKDETNSQTMEPQITWVAHHPQHPPDTGQNIPGANKNLLKFSGKEAPIASSIFWGKGSRLDPPKLRDQRRASKDLRH